MALEWRLSGRGCCGGDHRLTRLNSSIITRYFDFHYSTTSTAFKKREATRATTRAFTQTETDHNVTRRRQRWSRWRSRRWTGLCHPGAFHHVQTGMGGSAERGSSEEHRDAVPGEWLCSYGCRTGVQGKRSASCGSCMARELSELMMRRSDRVMRRSDRVMKRR